MKDSIPDLALDIAPQRFVVDQPLVLQYLTKPPAIAMVTLNRAAA